MEPTQSPAGARHSTFVCLRCHGPLTEGSEVLRCGACGRSFPLVDGIADFAQGVYYDEFAGPESLSPEERAGLDNEVAGATARVEDFYAPLLKGAAAEAPSDARRPFRVLDSGCGNGLSIDMLSDRGFETWGNDLSRLRRWQWRERRHRDRLVLADSTHLPFPDGFFDAVISSGVIEHIGVEETRSPEYSVRPRVDRDRARIEFLREFLRVLAPAGTLFLDCPNGAFPIDFWHGESPGGARFHSLREGFLPTLREVRDYVAEVGDFEVLALSPARRLRMRQVGQHWYGRVLRLPMTALLRLMDWGPLRSLAGSGLNPYLVMTIRSSE